MKILNFNDCTAEQEKKMQEIAERFFGTAEDSEQILINHEVAEQFKNLSVDSLLFVSDEAGSPVSWIFFLPTTVALMNDFLSWKISERELLRRTEKAEAYDALYLCGAFTLPEYRKRGYVRALALESFRRLPLSKTSVFFAWPVSKEGRSLCQRLSIESGKDIVERKRGVSWFVYVIKKYAQL